MSHFYSQIQQYHRITQTQQSWFLLKDKREFIFYEQDWLWLSLGLGGMMMKTMLKRKRDYRRTSKGFYMKKDRRKHTYLTLTTQRKIENGKKGKRQVWRLKHDFAYHWPVCTKFSKKFYTSVHLQQTIIFLRNKLKTVTVLYSFPFPVVVHLKRTWPRYVCTMYNVRSWIFQE